MTEQSNTNQMNSNSPSDSTQSDVMDPKKLDISYSDKMTDWKYEPSIASLKADLEFARMDNLDQRGNVAGWLALRNTTGVESGRKTKSLGRSTTQPKLIRKHNEWRYPALSEPFLNTDRMFNIHPRTFEDFTAAEQNQTILNWQFDTKINKVDFIDRFVRKTVDEGTCIVRVGWERTTEKVVEEKQVYSYFPIKDPQQAQVLAEATKRYMADPKEFERDRTIPDTLRASVEYGIEHHIAVYAKEAGHKSVEETKVTFNAPSLKLIDVANFFIDPSSAGDWQNASFMINTYESTESEIRKRKKFHNLDKVSWEFNTIKSNPTNLDHETETPIYDVRLDDKKSKVLVYEYWGECDINQDGIMVPIVVTFIGNTIIQMIRNPFPDRRPPFIIVPYMPIDGSVYGEADASLLQDNQRILGAVTRGMIDLLGRSANAQTGYAKGMLDPVNRKRFVTGEDFEFNPNTNPQTSIQQMKYPEIPNSALQMSQLQNAEAEGLSGVKSFASGITGDSFGKVARGISGAIDAAGQREMSILRRLAEGIRLIGRKIIAMNAHFLEEEEVVRVTNKEFVTIKREDLIGNFDLIVDISTANVDQQKSQDLGMMLQTMGPNMDPALTQIILSQIADLKRMPALAEKLRTYKPAPDPLVQKMKQLQISELEAKIDFEKAKIAKTNAEAESISMQTQLDVSGTSHNRNVETVGAQARGNRDLQVTKGLLTGKTPAGNIQAAVGFNRMTEAHNHNNATQGVQPTQQPTQQQPIQDPNAMVPPQMPSAQAIPLATLQHDQQAQAQQDAQAQDTQNQQLPSN